MSKKKEDVIIQAVLEVEKEEKTNLFVGSVVINEKFLKKNWHNEGSMLHFLQTKLEEELKDLLVKRIVMINVIIDIREWVAKKIKEDKKREKKNT